MKHKKLYIILMVVLIVLLIIIVSVRCSGSNDSTSSIQKPTVDTSMRLFEETTTDEGNIYTWSYEPYASAQSYITTILSDNANTGMSVALAAGFTALFNVPQASSSELQSIRVRTTQSNVVFGRDYGATTPKRYEISINLLNSAYTSVNVSFSLILASSGKEVYQSTTQTIAPRSGSTTTDFLKWVIDEGDFPATYTYEVYIEFYLWTTYSGTASNSFGLSSFSYAALSPTDYDLGYEAGYAAATDKYKDDYTNGYNTGYNSGYSAGETKGYDDGVNEYYQPRYDEGYQIGYNEGVSVGLAQQIESVSGLDSVKSLLVSAYSIFEIKIFGWFSLGDVVGVMVILGIFFFLLKIIRG